MQKKTIFTLFGGGCFVVILIGVGLFVGAGYLIRQALAEQSVRAPEDAAVAALRVERGSATISTSGLEQVVASGAETEVKSDDVISVSDDGRASIVWDGYGRTLLDAGTHLSVVEAERPKDESLRARVLVNIGRTWTRLERILDLDSEVSVGANNVVATVRGTSFGVERQGNQTSIKVKESKVDAARFSDPFSTASLTTFLKNFQADQTVKAGFKIASDDAASGPLDPSVEMTRADLNDPFILAGDRELSPDEYDLSGWVSDSERWLQRGVEYLAWRPWLLTRIDFGSGGSFREFYNGIPSDIRSDIEKKFGSPDFAEMERLLNW
jgi:hypothetical protein